VLDGTGSPLPVFVTCSIGLPHSRWARRTDSIILSKERPTVRRKFNREFRHRRHARPPRQTRRGGRRSSGSVPGHVSALLHPRAEGPAASQRPRRAVRRRSLPATARVARPDDEHERQGDCWDNACMESFWATLKNEPVHHEHDPTHAQARWW